MIKSEEVASLVDRKIGDIQGNLESSKPILAWLRRCAGKSILDSQDIWGYVLEDMPSSLMGKGREHFEPSEAEIAVHLALSLYAIHQQGIIEPVSARGNSFAAAVSRVGYVDKRVRPGVQKRFDAALTSSDVGELSNHLRGLVQLIRQSDTVIQVNYPLLARDLYTYQFPDGKKRVLMRWGEDYYRVKNDLENADKGEKDE